MFCYTLSARAIGATVSAGALHAQGWGFESLIAHHRIGNGPRKGTVFVWAHRRGIRTRQGAELRKRVSVFQRSTRGARRRSGSGRRSRTRHPSSPTTRFDRLPEMGAFRFSDQCRRIRTRQGAELRKRVSVFQRSTRGARRRSGSGRRSRTRHPSSPTTDLIGLQQWGPFVFGPVAEGFEPARVRS